MTAVVQRILTDVAAEKTANASLRTLVAGIAQEIRNSANDPAALLAIATDLESETAATVKAVNDNTDVAPATPPAVPPTA